MSTGAIVVRKPVVPSSLPSGLASGIPAGLVSGLSAASRARRVTPVIRDRFAPFARAKIAAVARERFAAAPAPDLDVAPTSDLVATQTVSWARPVPALPETPVVSTFLKWSHRVTVAGWLGLVALVVWGFQSGVLTSVGNLREFVNGFGVVAPAAYALVGAVEAIFPVVPGSVTIIAAPIIFGPVVGFFAAYAATCLGSTAVFALSRHVGADLLYARFRPATVDKYLGWLQHRHFTRWFVLAIALPISPDDLLCYLAGLSNMRWRTFLLTILLLKPWALIIYVFGVLTLLTNWFPWLAG